MTGCGFDLFFEPDDYVAVDYNIVWVEASRIIKRTLSQQNYFKIKNISKNEYIGYQFREPGFGGWYFQFVKKHKNFDGSLELDTTSAKLYLGGFTRMPTDDNRLLGKNILMQQEVVQVNSAIAEEVVNALSSDLLSHGDLKQRFGDEWDYYYDNYLVDDENSCLRLVLPVKEYDNLIWCASIVQYDSYYFIEIVEDYNYWNCSYEYLICSEELSALIEQVSEEYGLMGMESGNG